MNAPDSIPADPLAASSESGPPRVLPESRQSSSLPNGAREGDGTPKRLLVLQHSPIDGPGHLTHYFRRCGWETQLFETPHDDFDAIDPLDFNLVLSLGSGLSVYDRHLFPFIGKEIGFLERRLAARRPTLGICFGAQLIAAALGARVYRAPEAEIGWFALQLTAEGADSPLYELAPTSAPAVMHWHQDTFDLPVGTTRLARSALCDCQAFARGADLLALQFHPEVTPRGIEDWLGEAAFETETRADRIAAIRDGTARFQPAMQRQMQRCLDRWIAAQPAAAAA